VLCLAGATVGIVAAAFAIRLLLSLDPGDVPRLTDVGLNWRVVTFATTAALAATIGIGLVAAIRGTDRDLRSVLADSA